MNIFQGENLIHLINTVGYIGIFAIVFAESGLFFGFFLPGDSLLFTAGLLASQGFLNIWILLVILFVAAILGDNVGYLFGSKVGPKLFKKKNSLLFKQENVRKAEAYFTKYGSKTIILARFIPIVRTFSPIVAGVGKMKYRTFFIFDLFGGLLWISTMTLAGYYLSRIFPGIEKNLQIVILLIVFGSLLSPIIEMIREKRKLTPKKAEG